MIVLATPASAHTGTIGGTATCGADGTYTIVWSGSTTNVPASGAGHTATLTVETPSTNPNTFPYIPASSTVTPGSQTVVGNTTYTFTQTGIPGDSTLAQVTPYLHWGDGATSDPLGSIVLGGDCTQHVPVPGAPSKTTPDCNNAGVLTVQPAGAHVTESGGATGDGPGTYTITYTTVKGYSFTDGTTVKIYHITVDPKVTGDICKTDVSPVGPTGVTQPTCDGITPVPGSFVPPVDGGGITYLVVGNLITATITDGTTHKWGNLNGYTQTSATTATFTVVLSTAPTCPSGATPAAPTLTQSSCNGPGTHSQAVLHITSATGVVYKINGNVVTGDINEGPGQVVVVATAAVGYLFTPDQPVTFMVQFTDPGNCLVLAAPVAPTPTNGACTTPGQHSDASLMIPNTPHVVYKINGVDVTGQTLSEPVGTSLTVVATPAEGYAFDGPQTVNYPVDFTDPGNCLVTVAPVQPTLTQAQCDGPGSHSQAAIVIPSVVGVVYQIGDETVTGSIPVSAPGTVIVDASPLSGYVFPEGTVSSWTEQFTDTGDCLVGVTAASPTFTDSQCSAGQSTDTASYTIPATDHITYTIDGETVATGTYAAADGATVTIFAVPDAGYSLTGDATFSHTFSSTDCREAVIAATVSFSEAVCTTAGDLHSATYTVPSTSGVEYFIGANAVAAGTHNAVPKSTVTIEAVAELGFKLTGATQWTHTFAAAPQCLGVEPVTVPPPSGPVLAATGFPVDRYAFAGLGIAFLGFACLALAAIRRRGEPTV